MACPVSLKFSKWKHHLAVHTVQHWWTYQYKFAGSKSCFFLNKHSKNYWKTKRLMLNQKKLKKNKYNNNKQHQIQLWTSFLVLLETRSVVQIFETLNGIFKSLSWPDLSTGTLGQSQKLHNLRPPPTVDWIIFISWKDIFLKTVIESEDQ